MGVPGEKAPTFFGVYGEWMSTPPPTWDDVAWVVSEWEGPVMLKGVCRVDDALRAVDAGVDAISVSNHGGNNLDSTPATIRALPAVAAAVGSQIEVLLDGRAYLWGLAANGQAGVENVLDIFRGGIDSALLGMGHSTIHDLRPDDIVIPPGFTRTLGAPQPARG